MECLALANTESWLALSKDPDDNLITFQKCSEAWISLKESFDRVQLLTNVQEYRSKIDHVTAMQDIIKLW